MKPMLLVAEGDPELRAIYSRFLAERSYNVQTAADGLECIEKLRQLMPAVILLDEDLRWGGGDGVLAWLREQNTTVSVVLTATAGCSPNIVRDSWPLVVKVLPKPFGLTALLESVRAALTRRTREERCNLNRACSELFIG